MKLTARIKCKTSPLAKLIRRMSANRPMFIIDPLGDSKLLKRVLTAARMTGRMNDFCLVRAQPAPGSYTPKFS